MQPSSSTQARQVCGAPILGADLPPSLVLRRTLAGSNPSRPATQNRPLLSGPYSAAWFRCKEPSSTVVAARGQMYREPGQIGIGHHDPSALIHDERTRHATI